MGNRRLREFESFWGQAAGKYFSEFIESFLFNALDDFFGCAELDWGDLGNLLLTEGGNLKKGRRFFPMCEHGFLNV
jgi:hypothetical protein